MLALRKKIEHELNIEPSMSYCCEILQYVKYLIFWRATDCNVLSSRRCF